MIVKSISRARPARICGVLPLAPVAAGVVQLSLFALAATTAIGAVLLPNGLPYQQTYRMASPGSQGAYVYDSVIEGSDGRLYGATLNGGTDDGGIVFAMNKDGSSYVVLHEFLQSLTDGFYPWGTVIEASDGKLYGATRHGGFFDAGTVFRLNKDGTGFAIVRDFAEGQGDGAFPLNNVVEGSDGRLYGRTLDDGDGGGSIIFGLNKDGTGYQVLHVFDGALPDDTDSFSGLIEGSDGVLYGTTYDDGANGRGSIFKINRNGTGFVTLHDLGGSAGDGKYPYGPVHEASDGMLYGTTSDGGDHAWGILFKLKRDGTGYTKLYDFDPDSGLGYLPVAPPVEGPDGLLYGTTYWGGAADSGTIYVMHKDGTGMQFIYDFKNDGVDGIEPNSALLRGRDGALYGTTYEGNPGTVGSIFRLGPVSLMAERAPGIVTVALGGFAGHRYAIDAANAVLSSWTQVGLATNATGVARWTDFTSAPASGHRIYRARVLNP